uniref:Uncharacterized protein n=1 Tax=Zea mays TaxID=4577 RepID=B6T134_MAIZE|nr:hypothetical protein [Zea mays]
MPFTPGPYSGVNTLALVARASAFGVGVVYGSIKLSILKVTKPKKEEAHDHHQGRQGCYILIPTYGRML